MHTVDAEAVTDGKYFYLGGKFSDIAVLTDRTGVFCGSVKGCGRFGYSFGIVNMFTGVLIKSFAVICHSYKVTDIGISVAVKIGVQVVFATYKDSTKGKKIVFGWGKGILVHVAVSSAPDSKQGRVRRCVPDFIRKGRHIFESGLARHFVGGKLAEDYNVAYSLRRFVGIASVTVSVQFI